MFYQGCICPGGVDPGTPRPLGKSWPPALRP